MKRLPASALLLAPLVLTGSGSAGAPGDDADPLRVLIVTGENNHHWEFTSRKLVEALTASGKFRVESTDRPAQSLADAGALAGYDALVLDYNGPRWGEAAEASFLAAVEGGTGVVVVHAANNAFPGWEEYERLVGSLWREGTSHGRFHPFEVEVTDRDHPVTRGLANLPAHPDELYHGLVNVHGVPQRVLAEALSTEESGGSGRREPVVLVGQYGKGRVFHTTLGHVWRGSAFTRESFKDPRLQDLVVRGTEWAATGEVTTQRAAPNTLSALERAQGWQLLFDGETTAGWRGFKREGFPVQGWEVRGGCLVVSGGGGGDLITTEVYGDFDLDLEFKVTEKANSGIMYRVTEDVDATWHSGPEYQVLDDALLGEFPDQKHSVGALYDIVAPELKVARLAGHWNRARISVRGWKIEHRLNGYLTAEADLRSPVGARLVGSSKFHDMPRFARAREGHIALQDHGDEVWFRSIKLRDHSRTGALALFDGESLSGWTTFLKPREDGSAPDPSDIWSVDGGILACNGSHPGYVRTEAEFADFVLRLEWRWDGRDQRGGNSGLLLRCQGEDKVWPKSLEVQLQTGSAGDFWVIDGFPAEVEPSRTEGRRTRATHYPESGVGEWSRLAVVAEGGDVSVWVNDELVNQASGVLAEPGTIALQSEGGELHFRDVFLTPLD